MRRTWALLLSPLYRIQGYGQCYRCRLSCRFYRSFHETWYSPHSAVHVLCEHCWRRLSPDQRLPHYRRLVFGHWSSHEDWPQIEASIIEGR